MEIERLNKLIAIIHEQIKEVEYEKKELLSSKNVNVDCIDLDILEEESLELENQLNLETYRLNELLKLQEYQDSCSHVFVDDLIDITPDKSKMITYCAHCLFTPSQ